MQVKEIDGKKRLLVDFPLKAETLDFFHPKYSNYYRIKEHTKKLVMRLQKRGLLEPFHLQMMKAVSQDHIKFNLNFDHTKIHHHFLQQNYVLKNSSSTPLRVVSNTQTVNRINKSPNMVMITAPSTINLIPAVMVGWRMFAVAFCCDVQEFYRQLYTTDKSNNLRCLFWYNCENSSEILEKKLEPVVLQYNRATFGDLPSPIFSELSMRDYVSKDCQDPISSFTLESQRVVDDILYSQPEMSQVNKVVSDITTALNNYNFQLKYVIKTGDVREEPVSVLGLKWQSSSDLIYVNTTLNCTPKIRGQFSGEAISATNIYNTTLNRETLARLSGEVWSGDGVAIGPIQVAIRLMFGHTCSIIPDWKTALSSQDPSMDSQFKLVLSRLTNLSRDIHPYPRVIIPSGYVLSSINCSADAGARAYAGVIHMVSYNKVHLNISSKTLSNFFMHELFLNSISYSSLFKDGIVSDASMDMSES